MDNVGFLLSANSGLRTVCNNENPDDCVILLSNDVQIRGKFISQICDILESASPKLVGGILLNRDTGWNNLGGKIFPYLEGWLLATRVRDWLNLGYFDETFVPHIFEDIDLSTTALLMGYEIIPLNNVGLTHLAGQTIIYSQERDELTRTNQKKFVAKWVYKDRDKCLIHN